MLVGTLKLLGIEFTSTTAIIEARRRVMIEERLTPREVDALPLSVVLDHLRRVCVRKGLLATLSPSEAEPAALTGRATYKSWKWFDSEFGVPKERLRAQWRRHPDRLHRDDRGWYSVLDAMKLWPDDVRYLPGGH